MLETITKRSRNNYETLELLHDVKFSAVNIEMQPRSNASLFLIWFSFADTWDIRISHERGLIQNIGKALPLLYICKTYAEDEFANLRLERHT